MKIRKHSINHISDTEIIAGIDDATKCPCIGSIFLAGVTANKKIIKKWKKLGVKDSKLIASKKRFKLAEVIKETALNYAIHEVTPSMIDDKSILNLNSWEMLVVLKIVQELRDTVDFSSVYVDNWEVTKDLFSKRFFMICDPALDEFLLKKDFLINKEKLSSLLFIPEHHADENHIVVGAASILAKVASDEQYENYKKQYGDFGSGSPADPKTRLFVWKNRHNPPPIVRTSWNTFKMLVGLQNIEDDAVYSKVKNKKLK